jgi:hypothetical protein
METFRRRPSRVKTVIQQSNAVESLLCMHHGRGARAAEAGGLGREGLVVVAVAALVSSNSNNISGEVRRPNREDRKGRDSKNGLPPLSAKWASPVATSSRATSTRTAVSARSSCDKWILIRERTSTNRAKSSLKLVRVWADQDCRPVRRRRGTRQGCVTLRQRIKRRINARLFLCPRREENGKNRSLTLYIEKTQTLDGIQTCSFTNKNNHTDFKK